MSKKKKKLIRKSALKSAEEIASKADAKNHTVKDAVDKGVNSKALAKSNGKKDKKEKPEKKEKKKRTVKKGFTRRESPNRKRREFMANMVKQEKYTDQEIADKANEAFPITEENKDSLKAPFRVEKVSGIRYHIEHGNFEPEIPAKKYDRIIEVDGKKIKFSDRPKKSRKAKPKYDENSDPLNKMAGINVHKKEKKIKKKKQ